MKSILLFSLILAGCVQNSSNEQLLQTRVDSLEHKLADTYVPGFGEFMSGIQIHHNKLWFAGQNENWKLADFEIHEIEEAVDDLKKYETEREESKFISMINPILDSVKLSIEQESLLHFRKSYELLTATCNNCHRKTHFEFNVVKIPDTPPFSNQDFKLREKEK
ncbi:MAG TPA: hypothetical protein VFW11_18290 [Cyclobacteriaceae bacterium]|nr:hypothetical protein [Cyclobacteriaceae bacterium]